MLVALSALRQALTATDTATFLPLLRHIVAQSNSSFFPALPSGKESEQRKLIPLCRIYYKFWSILLETAIQQTP